jgi:Cellulase (glycosyl hydrolase family 5)
VITMRETRQTSRWSWHLGLPLVLIGFCAISVGALAQSPDGARREFQVGQAQAGDPAPQKPPNRRLGINPWETRSFLSDIPGFASTNVGSIRIDLPWQQVQPRPGVFNWDEVDAVVSAAQANRMDVLITLRAISSWGTKVPMHPKDLYIGASLPLDMSAWETFVSAMAKRYRGRDVAYEIENEPNSKFWSGTMADYLALLKASYPAITLSDPQARVLSGALACHTAFTYPDAATTERENRAFDTWQNAILATRAFNTIGVHDYYFPDGAVNGWTFATYLTHVQDLARAAGCDKCAIWITETGYVSRPQKAGTRTDPGSPQNQARWAAQAFRQAFDHDVERVYWLFLRDHSIPGYFGSMGLLDAGGTPRPAFSVVSH